MSGRFAVRVTALAFAAAFAFTTIGAPASAYGVKGADIVVKKKPCPAIVAHGVTDTNGSVDLGILPKGAYELTLTLPTSAATWVKTADVTIGGATPPIKAIWNLRPPNSDIIAFTGDGSQHVVIEVSARLTPQSSAVNSSRSNIKNNSIGC